MFKITKGQTTVGYTESPTYVTKMDNGDYGLASETEATCICFGGVIYAIAGREVDGEDLETAVISKVDGGALLNEQAAQLQFATTALEDAMCEQDAVTDQRLSVIEDALCELDGRFSCE